MRILVDADACPVKKQIVDVAKPRSIDVWMFFDTSHQHEDGYSKTFQFDKGHDSVDYALINKVQAGDIVVTQDYGVATMALSKNALPIHHNGLIYTDDNILSLLNNRATNQKHRKHRYPKGPKKRTEKDNQRFTKNLISLINRN
ncbi:YaiI/YqxD family protein [Candidatus Xianfuyuplasma coldseepsis]|uniref:UPF0178 protein G4Z02_07715 n=1 Tax=Candidatus Xianfuyuplasma coldseepsis TaxID=2782163 RepID=A0A7L7KTK0_9MOLU|nr:YaiI/YqxD family protein [Xianfuyuplasma coldseepsis]QMS85632.1 YaiI/YqxD family protein [Xianfuyuplasma coldseepsis]